MQVSDDPRVGTELAGYRIESLLGWGGMSVVYLAVDLRLKRRVALKLLAAGLAEDESFRDCFLRESELAASIDHPNIIPIYEAGTTGRRGRGRHLRRDPDQGPREAVAGRVAHNEAKGRVTAALRYQSSVDSCFSSAPSSAVNALLGPVPVFAWTCLRKAFSWRARAAAVDAASAFASFAQRSSATTGSEE